MHELSIASAALATVERHAGGRRVEVVTMRIGRLRQVVPEALEFSFGIVARDTLAEGARLEIVVLPAVLRCDGCGRSWEIDLPAFRCPECGSGEVAVEGGDELEVHSIELAEEAACTAPG